MTLLQFFKSKYPRHISYQIFLILLVFVVVPIILTSLILIKNYQQTLSERFETDLSQVTQHAAGEVYSEFKGTLKTLQSAASLLSIMNVSSWQQETILVELSESAKTFVSLRTIDVNGREIANSNLKRTYRDWSSNALVKCAMKEKECFSKVYISKELGPMMQLAFPIKELGKLKGVLLAQYSLRSIWDTVDRIQFAKGGSVYLINQQGYIIAHPDKKVIFNKVALPYPEVLGNLMLGKTGVVSTGSSKGAGDIVAYAFIDQLRWGLVTTYPRQIAFGFMDALRFNSWVLVFLCLMGMTFIALILSRRMSLPAENLKQAFESLGKGDMRIKLDDSRADDIGEINRAFNRMIQELRKVRQMEKLSIIGKSATSIAHELKNSLTLVRSLVQNIPMRRQDPAFIHESTETILRELDTWNLMLRGLMDFAKSPLPLHITQVDIRKLLDEIEVLASARKNQLGIEVMVQCDMLPEINIDAERIKQVLINLIANAFDAIEGSGKVFINASLLEWPDGQWIEIQVKDTGVGINEEDITKIFDPFYSTKHSGLGLGLCISRDIILRHEGTLDVTSTPGRGTCFTLRLPVGKSINQQGHLHDLRENRRR